MGNYVPMKRLVGNVVERYSDANWARRLRVIDERLAINAPRAIGAFDCTLAEIALAYGGRRRAWFALPISRVALGVELVRTRPRPLTWFEVCEVTQLCAAQCVGAEVPAALVAQANACLPDIVIPREDRERDPTRWYRWAAAALAARDLPLARRLHGHDQEPFVAGRTFGFDVLGLIAYLDDAIAQGCDFADLEAAWDDHLAVHPDLFASIGYGKVELLWIARLLRHDAGGHPIGTVGNWTAAELRRHVALEALEALEAPREGDFPYAYGMLADIRDEWWAELAPARRAETFRALATAAEGVGKPEEAEAARARASEILRS